MLMVCISAVGCKSGSGEAIPEVTGVLETVFLSAGQADAIVLKTREHAVIIDCGEKDDGDELLELLAEKGIEKVDYLFITHFDKDHVGGAAELIKNMETENVITPDYEGSVKEYSKFIAAAEEKGLEIKRLTANMEFVLDDVSFCVYPPLKSEYEEADNDYSLAVTVRHGENKLLFTGDAESERLKELMTQAVGQNTFDLLKVPHHGRYNEYTYTFVSAVKPEYAVITCSDKNPAEEKVIKALESTGSKIYYTSGGNITAVSDGKNFDITQEEKAAVG